MQKLLLSQCNKNLIFKIIVIQEYTVDTEVRAAHNVLEACAQIDTIDKVVFTSSAATILWRENRQMMSELDERHWSDVGYCRKFKVRIVI